MTTDETAALGLPRRLRSPWRWWAYATFTVLVLLGLSVVAADEIDVEAVVVACGITASGLLGMYFSWRMGVLVSHDYVEERGFGGKTERVRWADIREVTTAPGPSMLPSKTVGLVVGGSDDIVVLSSMSWYSFRPSRSPARVTEFRRIASVLMKKD
jgi:hypothetical protein